jgi:hypothetical protein
MVGGPTHKSQKPGPQRRGPTFGRRQDIVIYLEVGALILVVALISISDLIYRRVTKSGRRRGRASVRGARAAVLRSRSGNGPSPKIASAHPSAKTSPSSPPPAPGTSEFVRVKLRSGRIVEGWREAGTGESSGGLTDAFDLDVSKAFDPNGNPMSFPSNSFIVFTSQVERLEVLESSSERRSSREVAAERQRASGATTAPIAPVRDHGSKPARKEDDAATPSEEPQTSPAQGESSGGLGRLIQLPEPEDLNAPAAVLAPAPEAAPEAPPIRHIEPSRIAGPEAPSAPAPPAPRKKRAARPLLWVGAVVALLVVALIVDGMYTFFALSNSLNSARGDLRRGSNALLSGHYQSARAEFLKAATASGTADGLQGHPAFWVVSHLPRVHRDAVALKALGQSSDLSSRAGLDAVQAIRAMGAPAQGLAAAIYSHGQINLNAAQRGEPFFIDIEDKLNKAYISLRSAPQPVFGAVQSALSLALTKVSEARDAIHKTRNLVQALPSLFGRDQTRHYLLLFDNPSIARGSGGPIDLFGILTAKSGSLRVGSIHPVDDLAATVAPRTLSPAWFRKAYGPAGAFDSWDQVTRSPSFDSVAPIAQSLYQSATGTRVDGVVEMDPVALGLMTRAVGSVHQPGFNVAVNARNAVQALTHDVYLHFGTDQRARDEWVAGLIEQVWNRVSRGDATAAELTTALGDSSRGSHFTMYSNSPSDERALNQVGVGATFSTFEPNVQMAVTNNSTLSRLGYYEKRSVSTRVQLTSRGQAYVTSAFRLSNTAPKGVAKVLVHNLQSGQDRTDLSFILPTHARVQEVSLAGKSQRYDLGIEGANPRLTLPLSVPPGGTVRVVCSYVIPHAVKLTGAGGVFRFATVPQAAAKPDATSVTVIPPGGLEVVKGGSVGGEVDGSSYVASDTAGGPLTLEVKLAPPP